MATGIITKVAGVDTSGYNGDGIPATAAAVNQVYAIGFDHNDLLYIADALNNRIRKIDSAGIIHTVVGTGVAGFSGDSGPAVAAQLHYPEGVAFDSCGNMYICDLMNGRIRKVIYNGGQTPAPVVSIATGLPDTTCAGATLTFTATVTGGGTNFYYQWYVNGMLVSDAGNSYSYIAGNSDSVSCRVSTYAGCDAPSWAMSNTVHVITGPPLTTPAISITGITAAAAGSTVTLTASVSGAGSSYIIHWMNHGVEFTTTTGPAVSYTKGAGTDTITARIVPAGVCYDSATSAGHIVVTDHTGVGSIASDVGITLYPNPVTGVLYINASIPLQSVSITNLWGSEIYSGSSAAIDLKTLPAGIYIVRVNGIYVYRIHKQ